MYMTFTQYYNSLFWCLYWNQITNNIFPVKDSIKTRSWAVAENPNNTPY